MTRNLRASASLFILLLAACNTAPPPQTKGPEQVAKIVPADGKGESTAPRVGPIPAGAPVETAPPNVPQFKPAFEGQTRAPGIHSQTKFKVDDVATDLAQPWAVAFLPDGRMLVTEKHAGRLLIVTPSGQKSAPVQGVPKVVGKDQAGLLDIEVAPDFATSKLIYFSYVEPRQGGNGLAVAHARLVDGAQPKLEQLKVVFKGSPTLDSMMHAGGRIVLAPDGNLFVTLGERSILPGRVHAQDMASNFGKVARITPEGQAPQDNPFVDRPGARPEIWSLGHRNPLGAALDAQKRLWVAEMGPRGGDELNLIGKGKNYGWPVIGYGEEYSGEPIHQTTQQAGLEQPVYYWDPVISPGALAIYSGELFPEWKGNFFVAGLSSKALIRLTLDNDRVTGEERLLTDRHDRIRDVVQGPEGALYLLTDGDKGKLLKVTPESATGTPVAK
jgi:aldose sugar dehydrogenase